MKKSSLWVIVNFTPLILFVSGILMQNNLLLVLGEILFWFISIIGAIILLGVYLFKKYRKKISVHQFILEKGRTVNDLDMDTLPNNYIIYERGKLEKIVFGSVPTVVDLTFDICVTLIMIYFNYVWLPLFYMMHIVGLQMLRDNTLNFLKTGESYSANLHNIKNKEK